VYKRQSGNNAYLKDAAGAGTTYVVTTQAYSTGDRFSIVYRNGAITRFCGSSSFVYPTPSTAATFTAVTSGAGSTSGGSLSLIHI